MGLAFFNFYPADYMEKAGHLTLAEHGAYIQLLLLQWRTPNCRFPANPEWIKRRLRVDDRDFSTIIEPVLDEFFTLENGMYFQDRLLEEYDKANTRHKSAKNAANVRHKSKALKVKEKSPAERNAVASHPHCQPEPEPEPIKRDTNVSPKRGTRLPKTWLPSEQNIAYAVSKGMTKEEIENEADQFRDHWLSTTKNPLKTDWDRVWQTWCRNYVTRYRPARPVGGDAISRSAANAASYVEKRFSKPR